MDVFDLFAKIGLDTSDYEKGLDGASSKTHSFADKLKSGFSTIAKVGAVALTATTTAVAALTKVSLDGYADYEQLTGGVETLFKTSADAVMEYANNAYKTAGLSANEYMETVTSFSASLLQSLGGDTEAAAKYADMAITDMSDNANKMGTDMEMIQNAYQGFAKQNYTMLDNLKLGYGGTKEEMQRLLEDAERLSGQKFDLSSYADIVDAIHVVQTEMGITGTTAKEAATTIQGSVAAAKSAWENLAVGIADENADLDRLINNFVDSIATAGENIIPRIEKILIGIGTTVQKLAPILSKQIPNLIANIVPSLLSAGADLVIGLMDGIIQALPGLVPTAVDIVVMLVQGIIDALPRIASAAVEIIGSLARELVEATPQLLNSGMDMLIALVDGIMSGLPDMIARLPQIIEDFLNFITEELPSILDKGQDLMDSLVDGILNALPALLDAVPKIITSLVNFIGENLPKIVQAGINIQMKLIFGLLQAIPEFAKATPKIIGAIADGILSLLGTVVDVGKNIVKGLWDGIVSMAGWITNKVTGFFKDIFSGAKEVDMTSNLRGATSGFPINGSFASGLNYVPFDGFIAELHKGEMIVPAKEAQGLRGGIQYGNINITVNGAQYQDEQSLAQAIAQEIQYMTDRSRMTFA